ncbi:SRPBCC family protein [Thermococcus sp.]|uniref:SRPBCC family protein n=1 Tax=Thermococcus sp. TaxID=35749 RepID=UPI0025E18416|nr:SRPBCC family protein [Thermococcus sp.]
MGLEEYCPKEIHSIVERIKSGPAEFLRCRPRKGFSHCIMVAVLIDAEIGEVFPLVSDISNLALFWQEYEFRTEGDGRLKKGLVYHTRKKGAKRWVKYRITGFKENFFYSGEMVGGEAFLKDLRYEHCFIPADGVTLSVERINYTLRGGFLGRVLNLLIVERIIKKELLRAHSRLKEVAEKRKLRS